MTDHLGAVQPVAVIAGCTPVALNQGQLDCDSTAALSSWVVHQSKLGW